MRLSAIVTLSGLLVVSAALPAPAQTTERTLYVSVLDEKGEPVSGLSASDFTVREDGRAREVLSASRAATPLDLAIVVDNSQASTDDIQDLRRALTTFVERMTGAGQHQVALVGMADRPTILTPYTNSASELKKGIGRIFAQPGSGTVFMDTVAEVARGLQKREAERRAILLITNEGVDFSNTSHQRVLEAIRESGAAFHVVVLNSNRNRAAALQSDEGRYRALVIDQGTRDSGGRRDDLLSSLSLAPTLEKVASDLLNQYRVVYARPAALIPPDRVDVDVSRAGLKARGTPASPGTGA